MDGKDLKPKEGVGEVGLDVVAGQPKVGLREQLQNGQESKASHQGQIANGKTLAFFAAEDRAKDITTAVHPLAPENQETVSTQDNTNSECVFNVLEDSIQPLPSSPAAQRTEAPSGPGAYAVQPIIPARSRAGVSLPTHRAPTAPLEDVAHQQQQQQHLAEAQPVPEHDSDDGSLPLAEEYHHRRNKQSMVAGKRCYLCVVASFSLLLVAIILAVTLLRNVGSDQDHHLRQTQPPLSLEDRILGLLPIHTIQEIHRNVTTPQRQAFLWLLGDPFAHSYSDEQILQRYALACFYHATDGPRWTYNRNWLQYSRHECTWFSHDGSGNTTAPQSACHGDGAPNDDQHQGFARLWLEGNQLRGTIPPQLALLTSLTDLSIHFNDLTGTIPSSLGALTNLEHLGAIHSSLLGTLPTQLGLLTQLTALALVQNDLTSTVPSQLGLLTDNLEWLYLDNNRFTGTIPLQLYHMGHLIDFYFYNNFLTGQVPTEVGLLSSIEHLSLDYNLLEGTLPSQLGLLSSVEHMAPGHNAITGTLPSTLGLLSNGNFSHMKLAHNLLSGSLPSQLGLVGLSLQYMMLAHNEVTGALPTQLALLGNLTWLSLNHNQVSGGLPTELASLRNLTLFSVESNLLSGPIPEEFSLMAQEGSLVSMNVSGNPRLWGRIPGEVCGIGQDTTPLDHHGKPIRYYGLFFDCKTANGTGLCGCHCPCQ